MYHKGNRPQSMKNKTLYLSFFLLFGALVLMGFVPKPLAEADQLYWNPERKLAWSDYLGNPDSLTATDPATATHLFGNFTIRADSMEVCCFAYFRKSRSWVPKDAQTETRLAHEQLRFDITELYARMLKKKVIDKVKDSVSAKEEYKKEFTTIRKAVRDRLFLYEAETNHGEDARKENDWEEKIAYELQEFGAYRLAAMRMPVRN